MWLNTLWFVLFVKFCFCSIFMFSVNLTLTFMIVFIVLLLLTTWCGDITKPYMPFLDKNGFHILKISWKQWFYCFFVMKIDIICDFCEFALGDSCCCFYFFTHYTMWKRYTSQPAKCANLKPKLVFMFSMYVTDGSTQIIEHIKFQFLPYQLPQSNCHHLVKKLILSPFFIWCHKTSVPFYSVYHKQYQA